MLCKIFVKISVQSMWFPKPSHGGGPFSSGRLYTRKVEGLGLRGFRVWGLGLGLLFCTLLGSDMLCGRQVLSLGSSALSPENPKLNPNI